MATITNLPRKTYFLSNDGKYFTGSRGGMASCGWHHGDHGKGKNCAGKPDTKDGTEVDNDLKFIFQANHKEWYKVPGIIGLPDDIRLIVIVEGRQPTWDDCYQKGHTKRICPKILENQIETEKDIDDTKQTNEAATLEKADLNISEDLEIDYIEVNKKWRVNTQSKNTAMQEKEDKYTNLDTHPTHGTYSIHEDDITTQHTWLPSSPRNINQDPQVRIIIQALSKTYNTNKTQYRTQYLQVNISI